MKTLLLALLFAPSLILAQMPAARPELDIGGVTDFLGDILKQSKGASLVSGKGQIGGALYLPVWTFHDMDGVNYVHLGGGGKLAEGGKYAPIGIVALNLPALSARLWRFAWANAHVTRLKTPDIWFGPYVELPYLASGPWVIGDKMGALVSIGLGKKP